MEAANRRPVLDLSTHEVRRILTAVRYEMKRSSWRVANAPDEKERLRRQYHLDEWINLARKVENALIDVTREDPGRGPG